MKEQGLVIIMDNDIFTTSLVLAEGLNVQHHNFIKLLKKYSYIPELTAFETLKVSTKGRAVNVAYLNELQSIIIITLMKNSPEVIKFKINLAGAFLKQRKLLAKLMAQKGNAEWLATRNDTKKMRRECTDVIQRFIEYAKMQGSKSAEKYYMSISRMELTGLFIMEQRFPNARDVMSIRQLNRIEMADEAIAISLEDSMKKELPYKECYQKAKEKIEAITAIFPRSPLPLHQELQ